MRWLLVVLALGSLLHPIPATAAASVWVAPLETPGGAALASLQSGCQPLTLWLDAPPGDGSWALRPLGGPGALPELLGTWRSSGGLAAVATGIAPYSGSYVLSIAGPVAASRTLTVDCAERTSPAAPVAQAPPPVPVAARSEPAAPPPDPGPALVAGCLLVTVALMLSGWRRGSSGAGV